MRSSAPRVVTTARVLMAIEAVMLFLAGPLTTLGGFVAATALLALIGVMFMVVAGILFVGAIRLAQAVTAARTVAVVGESIAIAVFTVALILPPPPVSDSCNAAVQGACLSVSSSGVSPLFSGLGIAISIAVIYCLKWAPGARAAFVDAPATLWPTAVAGSPDEPAKSASDA